MLELKRGEATPPPRLALTTCTAHTHRMEPSLPTPRELGERIRPPALPNAEYSEGAWHCPLRSAAGSRTP